MIKFEFVRKIDHQGEDKNDKNVIKVSRNVVLPNKIIVPFVETFIPNTVIDI